jgi:low molecular weight protein-tyrosine phosphatase
MTASVLFVCTANVCRSPMAEGLLRRRLGPEAGGQVTSAGTRAVALPVSPNAVLAASERGADIAGHRPRPISTEMLAGEGLDLVVTMTREHVREVVALDRTAWPRTFTLKELVRRAGDVGPARDGDLPAWRSRLGAGRSAAQLLGDDPRDDVADPFGGPLSAYRRTAGEIDDLLARLVALLGLTGGAR